MGMERGGGDGGGGGGEMEVGGEGCFLLLSPLLTVGNKSVKLNGIAGFKSIVANRLSNSADR